MSISQLCISVPLSTSCTDFTVNSKFSVSRGSYLRCFSWLKHWTKRFWADFSHCFSRSVATGFKWLRAKYTRIHLSTEWDCLFPWKFDRLCFSKASGRDSKQNRIFLQRNWRIFTPQSRCLLNAVLTQMIRFWILPMMLGDRSAHTTWPLSVKQPA